MEKYGVDTVDTVKVAESTSVRPKCGRCHADLETTANVPKCPRCGTLPYEPREP